jgi:uncharacterized protein (DUF952 family)
MSHPLIYKILTLDEFASFNENKKFVGNPLDHKDGYMHFSNKEQYPDIIQKFFLHQKVVVLEIDPANLQGMLKFERNRPDGEEYPHLYHGVITGQDLVRVITL